MRSPRLHVALTPPSPGGRGGIESPPSEWPHTSELSFLSGWIKVVYDTVETQAGQVRFV